MPPLSDAHVHSASAVFPLPNGLISQVQLKPIVLKSLFKFVLYNQTRKKFAQATKILFETDEKSVTTLSSDSAELTSVPPRSPIVRKVNVHSVKNHWRENMDQDTRVVDRTLLARIEERSDALVFISRQSVWWKFEDKSSARFDIKLT